MRLINPFPFDEETYDYNVFLTSGGQDTPFIRVAASLIVLGINLMIGIAVTLAFLKVKGYLTKAIHFLCCGLCDDCDCDYNGEYPSRSISQRELNRRRRYKQEQHQSPVDTETYECICSTFGRSVGQCGQVIYLRCKSSRFGKRSVFFIAGVLGFFLLFHVYGDKHMKEPVTLIHSLSRPSIIIGNSTEKQVRRVFFIMPTIKSGIQPARLIRIAQALYPHRKFITWVIISTDPIRRYHWSGTRTEHWPWDVIRKWKGDQRRVMEHLEDLRKIVSRFGIPFVILSGHRVHHQDKGLRMFHKVDEKLRPQFYARHIGITWVTKTFPKGVIFSGHEDGVYNFQLFSEVQNTKLLSSWPFFGQDRHVIGLYTPVLNERLHKIQGFFQGGIYKHGSIPLVLGSYAVNLSIAKYLKYSKNSDQLWKLTMTQEFTSDDLDLDNNVIQYFGNQSSEIYAWQLAHTFTHVYAIGKRRIPLKINWIGTNIEALIEHLRIWFAMDLAYYA